MSLTALEPLIVARLQAELGASVRVLTAPSLGDVSKQLAQWPACVFVLYAGGAISDADARSYTELSCAQRWYVVPAVRNAANVAAGAAARADVGVLAEQALAALSGWRPDGDDSAPLLLTALPAPIFDAGYTTFPLEFTTSLSRQISG